LGANLKLKKSKYLRSELSHCAKRHNRTSARIKGCNQADQRADLEAVNGSMKRLWAGAQMFKKLPCGYFNWVCKTLFALFRAGAASAPQ
jgi:hypothetical protein